METRDLMWMNLLIVFAVLVLTVRIVLPIVGIPYARWVWNEALKDLESVAVDDEATLDVLGRIALITAKLRVRNTWVSYRSQVVFLIAALLIVFVLFGRWAGYVPGGLLAAMLVGLLPNLGYIYIEGLQLWGAYKSRQDRLELWKLAEEERVTRQAQAEASHNSGEQP